MFINSCPTPCLGPSPAAKQITACVAYGAIKYMAICTNADMQTQDKNNISVYTREVRSSSFFS